MYASRRVASDDVDGSDAGILRLEPRAMETITRAILGRAGERSTFAVVLFGGTTYKTCRAPRADCFRNDDVNEFDLLAVGARDRGRKRLFLG